MAQSCSKGSPLFFSQFFFSCAQHACSHRFVGRSSACPLSRLSLPRNLLCHPVPSFPAGKSCPALASSSTASLAPGLRQRFRGLNSSVEPSAFPRGRHQMGDPFFSGSVFAAAADAAAPNTAAPRICEILKKNKKRETR